MIGIGIDTGGTYTDAVIYDLQSSTVLSRGKAPTTHQKLEIGIENALNSLYTPLLNKADFLSLSTTLATNACVEGIGGKTKLILIGVEYKTVEEMYKKYGLPNPSDILFFDPKDDLWESKFKDAIPYLSEYESVAIVQLFPQKDGGKYEKTAKQILNNLTNLTCVCGNELFQERNVLRRAAGAILNAQLIPVIKNFINEVKLVLKRKHLDLPIIIVRSDGSVMSLEFAMSHPVETLLCGPAASVIAGLNLTKESDSLIIDMGGTTTDIAVVENGIPVLEPSGICIGSWKTFVKGLYVDTFGLGGDSAVRFKDKKLYLDNNRVVPLCVVADKYPIVIDKLKNMISKSDGNELHFLHEFYMLVRDIDNKEGYSQREYRLCNALKNGPLILSEAADAAKCDIYMLNTSRLEKEGIIIRCGLTPTDIMHIKGDFTEYTNEASNLGAEFVGLCTDKSVKKVADEVYSLVEEKLYCNIVKLLWKRQAPSSLKFKDTRMFDDAVHLSYKMAINNNHDNICNLSFTTKYVLIGIGAPVHIFLEPVARLIGTSAVIPCEAPEGNALGAVLGNVTASYKVEINIVCEDGVEGYNIDGSNEIIESYDTVHELAEKQAISHVNELMHMRGANDFAIRITSKKRMPVIGGKTVYYGETITASAAGKPDILINR